MELKKNNEIYDLWKKKQAIQEDFKNVMRLCREEISRPKTQQELNLSLQQKTIKMFL